MVASAEIAKRNGKKSRGPVTDKGKAIASQNATKHGMLAQQPPLLATEDLETFQGIMQGLIDEYQPASPTEHLLVQQVAMGWLRLHRLWGVEAAVANKEVLRAQQRAIYPDRNSSSPDSLLDSFLTKTKPYSEVLQDQMDLMESLIDNLETDLSQKPTSPTKTKKWLHEIDDSISGVWRKTPSGKDKPAVYTLCNSLASAIGGEDDYGEVRKPPSIEEAEKWVLEILSATQKRVQEVEETLADIERYNQAIQRAEAASKGLQNPELFSRYERHINHTLKEALDRLAAIKEQRNNKGSIGSFGKAVVEGP